MFFVLSRPFGPSNRPRWHGLRNKAWAFPSVFRLLGKREGGAFGGMTRDILINEEPLIFRKDIYALACVFGGLIYYVCTLVEVLPPSLIQLISATSIFLARVLSVKYHISVPVLKGEDESQTIKK